MADSDVVKSTAWISRYSATHNHCLILARQTTRPELSGCQDPSSQGFEMTKLVHHPAYLFVMLIVLLSQAAALGAIGLKRAIPLSDDARDNYNVVQGATLTLLALLIGLRSRWR
jgi:hypothetical protein